MCKLISDFKEFVPFYSDRNFVTAIMQLIRTNGYDHDNMLYKLQRTELSKKGSVYEYWSELVTIYNKSNRSKIAFQYQV